MLAQASAPALPLPPDPTAALQAMRASVGAGQLAVFGVASLCAGIVAIWLASLPVAGDRATFGRALKVWASIVGLAVVIAVSAAIGLPLAMKAGGGVRVAILVGLFGCLGLVGIIGIPMKVYEISVLRSIAWNVIHLIVGCAIQFGLNMGFLGSAPSIDPQSFRQLIAPTPPVQVDVEAVRRQLRERQEALVRRHELLEIRRRHLPPGDAQARDEYAREKAIYDADLERLRADARQTLPP